MTIEEAKQLLIERGFTLALATLSIGDPPINRPEPLLFVAVSKLHRCFDEWCCNRYHPIATETALKHMERAAFEAMICDDLEHNR